MEDSYVFKKEIDWSTLTEGITLPVDNQVIFGQIMGRFLKPGEEKIINVVLNGKTYLAKIKNVNFSDKWRPSHKKDIVQIRYSRGGDLSQALRVEFSKSFSYLKNIRDNREKSDRRIIKVPKDDREYLVIYTTIYDDTYVFDSIRSDDVEALRSSIYGKTELEIEHTLDYYDEDNSAHIDTSIRELKIRHLDRSICNNIKLLYNYRCQICGKAIGEDYGKHIAEAHHIDYFSKSLNNNSNNILVVCPNHHSVIHNTNPTFDRHNKMYVYPNGMSEKLILNLHI